MVRRKSAIIGEPIKLGYRYIPDGEPLDIPTIIKIEIWKGLPDAQGSALIQTIQPDAITRTAIGTYEYLMDAVAIAGAYYDRWFFKTETDGLVQNDILKTDVAVSLEAKIETCPAAPGVGYTFRNYVVPPGEWGEIVTYDDIVKTFLYGIRLQAGNGQPLAKAQVESLVEWAISQFESYLGIVIRRRKILTQPYPERLQYHPDNAGVPRPNLTRAKYWREGVDYTHEDDAYEFDPKRWANAGYLQMNYYPIISVQRASLFSYVDSEILNVLPWIRIEKKAGQLFFYPRMGGSGVGIYPFIGAEGYYMSSLNRQYPGGFKIDYEAGYESSDWVPDEIRMAAAKFAAVAVLSFVGNGALPGLASSSIGIDGMSESVSITQSASTTLYGARIKELKDDLNADLPKLRAKFSNFPIQFA